MLPDVGLGTHRFARKRRFVHRKSHRVYQAAVGRYLVAGVNIHYIADNHIFTRNSRSASVAHHLNRRVVVHLIENCECLVCAIFEDESQSCSHKYGHKDAYGFEKHHPVLSQPIILIERNTYRKYTGHT